MRQYTPLIVWMDLEMTGLEPDQDRIIEMATVITSPDLRIIATGPELVIHQPGSVLRRMDEWNRTHHGESGLIEKVRLSTVTEKDAERLTIDFLKEYVGERSAPLAGNSIHQDRRFIAKYMRKLDAFLHYRLIDVSTIKELARRWHPDVYDGCPAKKNAHRALDDIVESIEELKYFRERIFVHV